MPSSYVDPLVSGKLGVGLPVDLLGGESRLKGHIYNIPSWDRWDDRRRVAFLRQMAERYGEDPAMRWWVVQNVLIPANVSPMDNERQARALLAWVQTNIYYANEPGEQIQSPWRTLAERTGDCDDMALLLAAMAHSIGLGFKFAIAGRDASGNPIRWVDGAPWRPGRYSHIYLQLGWPALAPTSWASAEPTLRGTPLGYDVVLQAQQGRASTGRADLYGAPLPQRLPALPIGARRRYGEVAEAPAAQAGWLPPPGDLAREILFGVLVSAGTTLVIEALRTRNRRR